MAREVYTVYTVLYNGASKSHDKFVFDSEDYSGNMETARRRAYSKMYGVASNAFANDREYEAAWIIRESDGVQLEKIMSGSLPVPTPQPEPEPEPEGE